MSKTGQHMVCQLETTDILEWTVRLNDFTRALAKEFIERDGTDLNRISELNPIEHQEVWEMGDGTVHRRIYGVDIEFFLSTETTETEKTE